MDSETADRIRSEARRWIDQLNSGTGLRGLWRLQILDRRVRVRPDGSTSSASDSSSADAVVQSPTRIRRFCNGLPWALVNEAVAYLHSIAPYTGLVYNGVPLPGKYAPTRTRWLRDEDMLVDETKGANGTYTLVQDLVEMTSDAGLGFDGGGSCTETVKFRYEWDRFDVESIPPGTQGRTFSIQGVSRNEDGSFDYAVVERVAKTRVGEWAVTDANEFETVEARVYDNLYGDPDGGFMDGDGPDAGHVAVEPAGYDAATGVLVKAEPRQNEDCTWRVVVTRTTPTKNVLGTEEHQRTIYDHVDTVTYRAVGSSAGSLLDPVSSAGGGHTYTKKFDLRPDGLKDVTERVGTEIPVDSATVERSRTLRGVKVRRVDRNQPESEADRARAETLRLGSVVRIERTEGGLYNITHEAVDSSSSVGQVAESCAKTAFRHDHTVVRNQNSDPGFSHVESAAGGLHRSRSSRRTDEGTYDVTSESHFEIPEASADVERRMTLQGARVRTTDRNQTESAARAALAGMKLGDVVRITMNDGRSFDIARDAGDSAASSVGRTSEQCSKTIFRHVHTVNSNVRSDPGASVAPAGLGVTRSRTVRRTENDTFDVVSEETHELAVEEAVVENRRTLRGLRRSVQYANVTPARASELGAGADLSKLGTVVRIQKTDGDRRNVTVETPVSSDGAEEKIATACTVTVFEHTHSQTFNRPDRSVDSSASDVDTPNRERYETRTNKTEEGTVDVQLVVHKAVPQTWDAEIDVDKAYHYTRWFRNLQEAEYRDLLADVSAYCMQKVQTWSADDRDPSTYNITPSVQMNEFGLYDGQVSFGANWSAGSAGQYGEKNVLFDDVWYYGTNNWGFNASGRGKEIYAQILASDREEYADGRVGHHTVNGSFDPMSGSWTIHASTQLSKGEKLMVGGDD